MNSSNPLLEPSGLPYGAIPFDRIEDGHYMPAFREAIRQAKAEVDAIASNPEPPTFSNTIEALEFAGRALDRVSGAFYTVYEADSTPAIQQIAEEVSPLMTGYDTYVSLNSALFERVDAVHANPGPLERDRQRLLDKTWRSFVRGGALLGPEDKKTYSALEEELSLATLRYGRNVLDATNAFTLNITDPSDLAGLPQFVRDAARRTAAEKGLDGWVFDLSAPSYRPFLQYSERRDLRRQMFMAYQTRAVGGEHDNTAVVRQIVSLRLRIANLLGYRSHADYVLENRMLKTPGAVSSFLDSLLQPTLPAAAGEMLALDRYAREHGFDGERIEGWDFSFWAEKLKQDLYKVDASALKPYFPLDGCIKAVFGLATALYGLTFEQRTDIPAYNKDVKVYDVRDSSGRHMALLYTDFFPRATKRGGAWMNDFKGQSIIDGVEDRPFISLVTNFSKPSQSDPSLLTVDELETFLHEFGHTLHGILSEGRYPSLCTTNVSRDFVEFPSQIMENWAYEPEFLQGFARHYRTGEPLPAGLIGRIAAGKNHMAACLQLRQLHFGILDMAWHGLTEMTSKLTIEFENCVLDGIRYLPEVPGTCISTSITHLFSGGYSAGYYSYKWSEVLEADGFSLFKEKGIFCREVAEKFRREVLSRGSCEDEAVLYRNFRGHDPEVDALLKKLEIIK